MLGLSKISDLRIGWKLGLTSGLGVMLVAAMILVQMLGNGQIKAGFSDVLRNEGSAKQAINSKASIRGMQIGVRDVRLATTSEEVKKAFDLSPPGTPAR